MYQKNHLLSARIDDVTPYMNWERFEACIRMLSFHNIKPLLGVVPDCKDDKLKVCDGKKFFWKYIINLQNSGFIIAMHGYQHLYVSQSESLFPVGSKSEFAGLTYEEQFYKIKKGKEILEEHGIKSVVFMAPSHSYDKNTLIALKNNGFKYVTDGYAQNPYEDNELIFLPVCNSIRRVACLNRRWNSVTVVLHTNQMDDSVLHRYHNIFKNRKCCAYNDIIEKCNVKGDLAKTIKECNREIFIENVYEKLQWLKIKNRGKT